MLSKTLIVDMRKSVVLNMDWKSFTLGANLCSAVNLCHLHAAQHVNADAAYLG